MAAKFTHRAMDTQFVVSFGMNSNDMLCASAAAEVFARIDAIETLLSRFNDSSDVAVIRALKPGEIAVIAKETMDVLVACAKVCGATLGAFDPTVAPVMDLIRKAGKSWESLTAEEIEDAFARGGMQRLVLDVENNRVSVKEDALGRATSVELDFGGIGKGFALDECRKILIGEQYGIDSFLLDAGTSTVWAEGTAADGEAWRLGVGGVWRERTKLDTTVKLSHGALSGSGFEIQGAHVVDVKKRFAAQCWRQSWVVSRESAAIADALSTASLALDGKGIRVALANLDADVLVAREQNDFLDRFLDPLKWFRAAS